MAVPVEPIDFTAPAGKAANDAPPPYRLLGPVEIWAPIPPKEYALGPLGAGDVAMMVATGNSLKSWSAADGCIAKAAGVRWLERFDVTDKGNALYLDFEMGTDEARRRLQRSALGKGLEGPVDGVFLISMPNFTLNTPEGIASLRELAIGRSLVVVDSLSASQPGADENDPRFADVLKHEKRIGDETGTAFLNLHHSRKAKDGEDERERPRGTSALYAACDVVWQMGRAEGGFLVTQTKARTGRAADPFVVRVDDVEGLDATRVYATEPQDDMDTVVAAGARGIDGAKAKIVALLAHEKDLRTQEEIARRLGGRKKVVCDALKELVERKLVVTFKGCLRLTSEVEK